MSSAQIVLMNSTVNVHLRVPLKDARLLKRAAKLEGKALATYVREAAVRDAKERMEPLAQLSGEPV